MHVSLTEYESVQRLGPLVTENAHLFVVVFLFFITVIVVVKLMHEKNERFFLICSYIIKTKLERVEGE